MVVSVAFNLPNSVASLSKSDFFFSCHNSNMKTGPLQVKENIKWFALIQSSETMDFPNNPCTSYCQPDQSNTALKIKENISGKNLRISYTSGALKTHCTNDRFSGQSSALGFKKHLKKATCTRQTLTVFSAPSCNSTAIETYIGHPYSPPVHQPTALHEEGCRSQRVASPSCTVPCLLIRATVHFFPPSTPR